MHVANCCYSDTRYDTYVLHVRSFPCPHLGFVQREKAYVTPEVVRISCWYLYFFSLYVHTLAMALFMPVLHF